MPRSRRLLLAAGCIAGPLLAMIGALVSPETETGAELAAALRDHPAAVLAGAVLMAVGAACFIALFATFAALAPDRGRTLATLAAVLGGFGAAIFSGALLSGTFLIAGLPGAEVARVVDGSNASALGAVPWFSAYLLPIGVLLGGIAVLRARAVPVWTGVLLVVGVPVSFLVGSFGPLSDLLWLPVVAAAVGTGRALVAGPRAVGPRRASLQEVPAAAAG